MEKRVFQRAEDGQTPQYLAATDVSTALARCTPKRIIDVSMSNPPYDLRPNKRMKSFQGKAESERSPAHSRQLRKSGVTDELGVA